jgi:hypothetical protein
MQSIGFHGFVPVTSKAHTIIVHQFASHLSKAASKKTKASKKEFDFGVEIPFHKPTPAGFHDVGQEDSRADTIRQKQLHQVDYQKINEHQYRSRDKEAAKLRKKKNRECAFLNNPMTNTQQYIDKVIAINQDHAFAHRVRCIIM